MGNTHVKKLPKSFETIFESIKHRYLTVLTLTLVVNGLGPPVRVDFDHGKLHYVSETMAIIERRLTTRSRAAALNWSSV